MQVARCKATSNTLDTLPARSFKSKATHLHVASYQLHVTRCRVTSEVPTRRRYPGCPSKLALHALGKGAMMYIDMINDNLDRSTVEVQVLTACGKSQLVMKSVMKDIKFTPKVAAAQ